MKKTHYTLLAIGAIVIGASLMTGCVKDNPDSPGFEYFPDMYRSPGPETNLAYTGTGAIDSMANRLPAPGSIPVGHTPFPYPNTPEGDTLAHKFWRSPLTINEQVEKDGQFLYERFCIYCHGKGGAGDGPLITSEKYTAVPNAYTKRQGDGWLTDGHVYHVITYGKGQMGSHASQLSPEERWKVVAYVQKLGRGGKSYTDWQKELNAPAGADTTKTTGAAPASQN